MARIWLWVHDHLMRRKSYPDKAKATCSREDFLRQPLSRPLTGLRLLRVVAAFDVGFLTRNCTDVHAFYVEVSLLPCAPDLQQGFTSH